MSGALGLLRQVVPLTAFFGYTRTEIGLLKLDVLLEESMTWEGKVTSYPVEDGTEISDHIFDGSRVLSISGTQSVAEAWSFNFFSRKARLIDAMNVLEQIKSERKVIQVSTGLMVYTDMGIETLKAKRSAGSPRDGNWLDIEATLRKIKKVQLRTADVPAGANRNTTSTTGGANNRTGQTETPTGSGAQTPRQNSTAALGIYNNASGLYDRVRNAAGGLFQ